MMRAVVAILLVWRVAAAQEPTPPFTVVVLPAPLRDSMSAIWSQYNRNWNAQADVSPFSQTAAMQIQRLYLGCLAGYAARDTLWVRDLAPATNLRHREASVTGDCSNVADLIGTWHTHLYRPYYDGHPIKERGLSGADLRTFVASRDLVTIVIWDADSFDVATKGPGAILRHPGSYIVR
jgi:hypothetical protein